MVACLHVPAPAENSSKALQECAQGFAPEAELTDQQTILFDVSRLNRLYGAVEQIADAIVRHAHLLGLAPRLAIAPNPETALLLARNFEGATIAPEEAQQALARLDIQSLPLTDQLWAMLESWGVRNFRDLAQLPTNGVAGRLGPEGVYLQNLARGALNRPLRIAKLGIQLEERVELEHPLTNLEPLLFIIARILNDQCEKMQSNGFATNALRLTLELDNLTLHEREISLPVSMRQSKAMLKLLQLDLEAHPPGAAIVALHLRLQPVQPRTVQTGIFLPATPAPDKLEVTLARIRALVGNENVGVPELLDTHRPEPFRLVARQPALALSPQPGHPEIHIAFRYFQPPLKAMVEIRDQQPLRLSAGAIRGNVITSAGPWRSSGDWWTGAPWNRDEWDVSLNDGAIYRIYRNSSGEWFIEGTYD